MSHPLQTIQSPDVIAPGKVSFIVKVMASDHAYLSTVLLFYGGHCVSAAEAWSGPLSETCLSGMRSCLLTAECVDDSAWWYMLLRRALL